MVTNENYQARLRLTFEGESLENHEIDVGIFASSLLSLSLLIKKAHLLTFNDDTTCQFRLTSVTPNCVSAEFVFTAVAGAFFVATQVDWEKAYNLFLQNIGFAKNKLPSLPTFFKKLRKRKIVDKEFTKLEDIDIVILRISDGTTVDLPYDLYKLIANSDIRKNQFDLLKPLAQKGITTITYLSEVNGAWVPATSISREELELFEPDVIAESPQIEEFTVVGNLDRPSLHGDPKNWKIVTRNKIYSFDVMDERFISLVRNNEIPFLGSDFFEVSIRAITPPAGENKRTHYEGFNIRQVAHQRKLFE